ncbi:MAG: CRISPR-associated protein Cas5 [Ginsengibacter sp.]
MSKVISFDLLGDFGFFKKPFSNEKLDLYLTFNMIHKPALLGILGAVLGLPGFREYGRLPEYYEKLKSLKIGIEPIETDETTVKIFRGKGIFSKFSIKYNNAVGYANSQGGILNIHEQILLSPAYRCYILLDNSIETGLQSQLEEYLTNGYAEYLPYFGKNEFSCWWEKESVKEYSTVDSKLNNAFSISSIFYLPDATLKDSKMDMFDFFSTQNPFAFFERLPVGFIHLEDSYQYQVEKFTYSNFQIKAGTQIENLYTIKKDSETKYVQLF